MEEHAAGLRRHAPVRAFDVISPTHARSRVGGGQRHRDVHRKRVRCRVRLSAGPDAVGDRTRIGPARVGRRPRLRGHPRHLCGHGSGSLGRAVERHRQDRCHRADGWTVRRPRHSFLKAVQMAQSDLRGTKYQYQLVLVDVGQDPYQARAAIQRAIQDERVSAIVGGISRFGQVTRPLASAAQILHTCVCSVTSIGDGAYNFTNIPSPEAEGVRWVQEAQRRGIRNIALLTQDYPSIQGHLEALKVEVRRAGLTITDAQEFDDSVTDFRKLIARARASHPDVYYVEALNPQLDELAQQLADAKIRNIASVVAPSVSQRPELFEATWYTDSNLRDFAFKTRFEKLYPGTQFATHMMPYAYDDFNMIVQAFERGENPAVYVRNIRTYDGNAGTLTKLAGSGNFQSMPAVWEIEHGKPVLLSHQ